MADMSSVHSARSHGHRLDLAPSRKIGALGGTARDLASSVGGVLMTHEYLFQKISPLRAWSRRITSNAAFELVVFLAIATNVVGMAMENVAARRAGVSTYTNGIVSIIDNVTLTLFFVEFVLRVFSHGLLPLPKWFPAILRPEDRISIRPADAVQEKVQPVDFQSALQAAKDAHALVDTSDLEASQAQFYFKSNWNRLDFIVLFIGILSVFLDQSHQSGLSSLRSLRALRPLRMIQFVEPLQVILKSIWRSVRTLVDVFICLCFMFLLFALFGQQMYQGSLRRRCVIPQADDALRFDTASSGFAAAMESLRASSSAAPTQFTLYQPETFCSFDADPRSFSCDSLGVTVPVSVDTANGTRTVTVPLVCANYNKNPGYGMVDFDYLQSSLWTVFMMTSLEVRYDVLRLRAQCG